MPVSFILLPGVHLEDEDMSLTEYEYSVLFQRTVDSSEGVPTPTLIQTFLHLFLPPDIYLRQYYQIWGVRWLEAIIFISQQLLPY